MCAMPDGSRRFRLIPLVWSLGRPSPPPTGVRAPGRCVGCAGGITCIWVLMQVMGAVFHPSLLGGLGGCIRRWAARSARPGPDAAGMLCRARFRRVPCGDSGRDGFRAILWGVPCGGSHGDRVGLTLWPKGRHAYRAGDRERSGSCSERRRSSGVKRALVGWLPLDRSR